MLAAVGCGDDIAMETEGASDSVSESSVTIPTTGEPEPEPLVDDCVDPTTCGFDVAACQTGNWHMQTIEFTGSDKDYWLRAQCDAHVNDLYVDGLFKWNEQPVDDPDNDPQMCNGPDDIEADPGLVSPDDVAEEDAGMVAAVTWTLGTTTTLESTQDASLRFAYDLHDCATHVRCLDLAKLEVSLPTMTVQTIAIENAHLSVYQVDTQPAQQTSGAFSYAPGTIHAIMSATAAGVPLMLMGANSGTATGLLSPGSDTLTFSGLTFDYSDSVIAAQLQVDIVGDYPERGPTAVIVPADVPVSCTDPVTFRAASSDPDVQTLTHLWWVLYVMAVRHVRRSGRGRIPQRREFSRRCRDTLRQSLWHVLGGRGEPLAHVLGGSLYMGQRVQPRARPRMGRLGCYAQL